MTTPRTETARSTRPRARRAATAGATLVAASLLALAAGATGPASAAGPATPLCGQFDAAPIDGGRYLVQNNRWGTGATQCVVPGDGGFLLERADGGVALDGPPKSYPSIVAGCHWGRCSTAPGLPVRARDVGGARTAASVQRSPGTWNVAYDLWFDSSPRPTGQNDDAELMIWLDHRGGVQPLGTPRGTVDVAGERWTVWQGDAGWDVVTFVRQARGSHADLPLAPFVDEAVRRGAVSHGSWLTSVQLGVEPWVGGAGLAVEDFSYDAGAPAP